MGFEFALAQLKAGARIRRTRWRPGTYLKIAPGDEHGDFIKMHIVDRDTVISWSVKHRELVAIDWEVLSDGKTNPSE